LGLLLAGSAYLAARNWLFPPEEANAELAAVLRKKLGQGGTITVQGPTIAIPPPQPESAAPRVESPAPQPPLEGSAAQPSGSGETTRPKVILVPEPARDLPPEGESESDKLRRLGAEEFARAIAVASAKADEADINWRRYSEGCRQNILVVTSRAVSVAAAGDREWFAVAGAAASSTVTSVQWTEACADIGNFLSLTTQVHGAVCEAEDRARRNHVYPGVRRDIRQRYRLEWWGWDHYCPTR